MSRLVHFGLIRPRPNESAAGHNETAEAQTAANWAQMKTERTQAGKVWTKAEDDALLREFDAGIRSAEIAAHLGRGVNAGEVRLIKLGRKLTPALHSAH